MWVSEPYADHEWWLCQCNGQSLYLNAEEEPKCWSGEPQQACSVYRRTKTDSVSICLRHQRPVVCCLRSKPLTNKLPWLAGGITLRHRKSLAWTFSPQPASSQGSSHSISLSKPNDPGLTCVQWKKKKWKKKRPATHIYKSEKSIYSKRRDCFLLQSHFLSCITKMPKLMSNTYAISTFFTSTHSIINAHMRSTDKKIQLNYIKEQATSCVEPMSFKPSTQVNSRRHFTDKLLLEGGKTRFIKQSIVNINKLATRLCRRRLN